MSMSSVLQTLQPLYSVRFNEHGMKARLIENNQGSCLQLERGNGALAEFKKVMEFTNQTVQSLKDGALKPVDQKKFEKVFQNITKKYERLIWKVKKKNFISRALIQIKMYYLDLSGEYRRLKAAFKSRSINVCLEQKRQVKASKATSLKNLYQNPLISLRGYRLFLEETKSGSELEIRKQSKKVSGYTVLKEFRDVIRFTTGKVCHLIQEDFFSEDAAQKAKRKNFQKAFENLTFKYMKLAKKIEDQNEITQFFTRVVAYFLNLKGEYKSLKNVLLQRSVNVYEAEAKAQQKLDAQYQGAYFRLPDTPRSGSLRSTRAKSLCKELDAITAWVEQKNKGMCDAPLSVIRVRLMQALFLSKELESKILNELDHALNDPVVFKPIAYIESEAERKLWLLQEKRTFADQVYFSFPAFHSALRQCVKMPKLKSKQKELEQIYLTLDKAYKEYITKMNQAMGFQGRMENISPFRLAPKTILERKR